MENLGSFGRPCNRRPGRSQCLRKIGLEECEAEVDTAGNLKVRCVSGQAKRGIVPVKLILLFKKNISPCCGEKMFLVGRTGALCCPGCVSKDYCPVCRKKIDVEHWICDCTRKGIIMPVSEHRTIIS